MAKQAVMLLLVLVFAAAAPRPIGAASWGQGSAANPVREVVASLRAMEASVTDEGREADDLFEKYMSYCENSGGELAAEVEAAGIEFVGLAAGAERGSSQGKLEGGSTSQHAGRKASEAFKQLCDSKAAIHAEERRMRAQEVAALAETLKVLDDADAHDLFDMALASSSGGCAQMRASVSALRAEAGTVLAQARSRLPPGAGSQPIDFISLALHGHRVDFERVAALVDERVAVLEREQAGDDRKMKVCAAEPIQPEDTQALSARAPDVEKAFAEAEELMATLTEEVRARRGGIAALDKSAAEATDRRGRDSEEHKGIMAVSGAAKQLILAAKNRLQRFYHPAQYRPGLALVGNSGAPPLMRAPRSIARAGVSVGLLQVAFATSSRDATPPLSPPETAAAYTKKSEECSSVVATMDLLAKNLDESMAKAETEEKAYQEDFGKVMDASAKRRAADSKALGVEEAAMADMQRFLAGGAEARSSAPREPSAAAKYAQGLHAECTELLQRFDVDKRARADEIDALGKARALLSFAAAYPTLQRAEHSCKLLRHA